jgi:hypothetical protein
LDFGGHYEAILLNLRGKFVSSRLNVVSLCLNLEAEIDLVALLLLSHLSDSCTGVDGVCAVVDLGSRYFGATCEALCGCVGHGGWILL